MFKIRWSWDCLIFNMGIPILVRWHLYIELAPWGIPKQQISMQMAKRHLRQSLWWHIYISYFCVIMCNNQAHGKTWRKRQTLKVKIQNANHTVKAWDKRKHINHHSSQLSKLWSKIYIYITQNTKLYIWRNRESQSTFLIDWSRVIFICQ